MRKIFAVLLFIQSFVFILSAQNGKQEEKGKTEQVTPKTNTGEKAFPEPIGWVNDFEEVIDSAEEEKLTKLILDHNRKTSNQISIVTISSIAPYQYLADYAKDISNAWGVGEKEKNNGVTIIYSKALHEVRIATGYGIENKLTDSICEKIVNERMIPPFKAGDYGKGLIGGVTEIIRVLEL
ncbi:MAG TPA: TPM domain-containing protein [Bacteroidia bacterium]|jgi:uncharacterized protein|nr:TPM domain-containing protein [Bacteroidia bacterium]